MYKKHFLLACFILLAGLCQAQQPTLFTRPSQQAKVSQRIGTTDMEIIYHAPLTNGRTIFGDVVPYNEKVNGQPQPWRAGANENTVISFGHDVQINGKPLKAGTYGLHIFVSERSWQVTFSGNYQSWGSFSYKADEDVLRVPVTPQKADHQEWLSYRFLNPTDHSATVELHWADQLITFEVSTNVNANILADIEALEEKTWQHLVIAANSVLALNPNDVEKAMELVDQSLAMEQHLENRLLKADLLEKKGKKKESEKWKKEGIENANAIELFSYAMSLNNKGETTESLKILKLNEQKHPDHWYVYLGYGNYYRTHDDPKAIAAYEKTLELAPDRGRGFAIYQLSNARTLFGKQ